jgi:hypothetical protein
MNNAAIKYKLYKQLLEGNISNRQYDMLLELGIIDKLKSFFGAGAEVGGDLAKLFKDKANQKQLVAAKNNIGKAVKDLKDIAAKAGMGDDVVNQFLQDVLKGSQVDPGAVASAQPTSGEAGKEASTTAGPKPGALVDPSKPEEAVPAIAAAAAQAAGQDPEKAKEQAEEKKVDVPKATQVLAKAISTTSKVDPGKVAKIIDFLVQNKHMMAEGRRVMTADIVAAAREASSRSRHLLVLERWNSMAGVGLLNEEAAKPDEAKKKKFEDLIDDIRKKFKPEELSDDDILNTVIALDDLDSIQIK